MPRHQVKVEAISTQTIPISTVLGVSRWVMYALLAVVVVCASLGVVLVMPAMPRIDSAAVRLPTRGGWGSGVAIGPHLVMTAAHVIKSNILMVQVGSARLRGEVLWKNDSYDLALIEVPGKKPLQYRDVSCGVTYPGQDVVTSGYPAVASSLLSGPITTKGVISSRMQHNETWRDYVVLDALGTHGGSGSGVLDMSGRIVGIFVGIFGEQHLDGEGEELFVGSGYNVMVPSTTLCRLLGR